MKLKLDLAGKTFGRLRVVGLAGRDRKGNALWKCDCICGISTAVARERLLSGKTRSCGCLRAELLSIKRRKHGLSNTSTHHIWTGMIARCTNKKNRFYNYYGGRGISVCERWVSFENFIADMGLRPPTLSIERIDNNGNYEPSNCKWATRTEQQNNKRSTILLTFNGRTQTMSQWAEEVGIITGTLWYRLKAGWNVHKALTEKLRKKEGTAC